VKCVARAKGTPASTLSSTATRRFEKEIQKYSKIQSNNRPFDFFVCELSKKVLTDASPPKHVDPAA
jgi:hypothetical protein